MKSPLGLASVIVRANHRAALTQLGFRAPVAPCISPLIYEYLYHPL